MNTLISFLAQYLFLVPPVVFIVVLVRLKADKRAEILFLLILSAVLTTLLVKLATTLHQDPRPFIRNGIKPLISSSTDNGFPSDHSAFSALIAFVVMKYNRRVGLGLFIIALLVGTARVLAGVHHTQDIIGGIVIAGVSVGICLVGTQMIERRA
jgi:undecaprenyl-diphosphatase